MDGPAAELRRGVGMDGQLSNLARRDPRLHISRKSTLSVSLRERWPLSATDQGIQDLNVADANINVELAQLQEEKAQIQFDFYDQRINNGLNEWEKGTLAAMGVSIAARATSGIFATLGMTEKFDFEK